MEILLRELSNFSILFALIAAIFAGILANIIASLVEKVAGEHPRIKALTVKKQLCLVSMLFVIFSLPSIYQQVVISSTEGNQPISMLSEEAAQTSQQVIRIKENSTVNLFDGNLFITLVKFSCFESSEKEIVIGSPGFENLTSESVQIGNSFLYEAKKPYEVRVVKTDPWCSWIEVKVFELAEFPETPDYILEEIQAETLTVSVKKTGFTSDGKLSISVTYQTSVHVFATIGSSGFPNKNISREGIGYILEYEAGEFIYIIRILEVTSSDTVKFQVTKFQKKILENQ